MICTSEDQAFRVAVAGARKMTNEGYTLRPIQNLLPVALQSVVYVRKSDGTRYKVALKSRTCNCAFYVENARFRTCKHLEWAIEEHDFEVRAAADAMMYAAASGEDCSRW